MEYTHIVHELDPVFDENCRVLILGSLPSVLSRENRFYYGNPQNRFWKVLAAVLDVPLPQSIDEKKAMLLAHHIALWDTVAECDILGSADTSIRNVVPTQLSVITAHCRIERIFANGATAKRVYDRYQKPLTGMDICPLPSTSPANAAWNLERLCTAWQAIRLA